MLRFLGMTLCVLGILGCSSESRSVTLRIDPRTLQAIEEWTDFYCVGINVVGENIESQLASLDASVLLGPLLSGQSACSYPGVFEAINNPLSTAAQIDFLANIPKGNSRIIQIFGIDDADESAECSLLTAADIFDEAEGDRFSTYLIGTKIVDILSEDDVVVDVSLPTSGALSKMDCNDEGDGLSEPGIDGTFSICTSNPSDFITYSSVTTPTSQSFKFAGSGTSAKVTVDAFASVSDCSGNFAYRIEYNYENVAVGDLVSVDASSRNLYELDFTVLSIYLTADSTWIAEWSSPSICNQAMNSGTAYDVTGACGLFPPAQASLFDIVAKSGASLYFGTKGPLGASGAGGRPTELTELSYDPQ